MRFRRQIKQLLIFLISVVISLFFLLLIRIAYEEDVFTAIKSRNNRAKLNRFPEVIQTSVIPMESVLKDTNTVENHDLRTTDSIHVSYYIIIGSFKDQTQARQKADRMQNDLHEKIIILPPSDEGYIRISMKKCSTFEEALSSSKDIRENVNPDAWILSMKE
ncbi:MAG TPA: SPOR domain-containing protein [Bacteroidales bacterium]|nr:SPOR domain-containing protein [Bacteroidales bacterium]HQK68405.1 SPOR domain-containing protein [Bacteroidales bacterium]